jgi:membrane protease YdiL (CAAX protease family)
VPRPGNRWRLPLFFGLAYLFTWSVWIPMAARGVRVRPGSGGVYLLGHLGPMVAAFAVSALLDGRSGVAGLGRAMLRWRVGWRATAIALATPLAFGAIGVAAFALAEGRAPELEGFALYPGVPAWGLLPALGLASVFNGFGEETGWRGFALPALERRFSPLAASLVLAPLWALWHWPAFLLSESYRAFSPLLLLGFLVGLAAGSVVLAHVYHRCRDSVLLAVGWHVVYNFFSATAAARGLVAAATSALVIAWAVSLVRRELLARRRGESVLRPTPAAPDQERQ